MPVSAKLATAMAALKLLICLILHFLHFAAPIVAQYNDDSDYNEYDFYDDLPLGLERTMDKSDPKKMIQDDFYIVGEFDDSEREISIYPDDMEPEIVFSAVDRSMEPSKLNFQEENWYKIPEKVYRYTKHRIPGYDYDELNFMGDRRFHECDDNSLWTHCVCQFTCAQPDIVDCYTPCVSGCECKENYVFDEQSRKCLLPEKCPPVSDYFTFK
ncbi:uncharacterized protein LOC107265124 [Cephus cinctus]|uniref:Uncharacterized protein LOC107265124 n=1 Tax=Cephus cinctus TaxID=211228 RepID=A0AAJ7BMC2_CEPCN|nr:uncharacterized protein LOC107265124 [Cephus cinctus]